MNPEAVLTEREAQVTELLAWGAAKKEVAAKLQISTRTVEALTRRAYKKIEIQKAAELSAWYFCKRFNISFDLSPLRRGIYGAFLLLIMIPEIVASDFDATTARRASSRQEVRAGRGRRRENEGETYEF